MVYGSFVRSPDTRPLKMLQDARMAASTGRKAAFQMTGERQLRAENVAARAELHRPAEGPVEIGCL